MPDSRLPDFIIGGAMKCGTSSMHSILSSHEDVFIPRSEVHFFSMGDIVQHRETIKFDPGRVRFGLDEENLAWYRSFFNDARSHQLIGEDSTGYLPSQVAPERIQSLLPDVKLVFMLRNPADRTYSHYMHLVNSGRATMGFEEELIHGTSSLHLRSFYKPQIKRYLQLFPRDQIKVIIFERFIEETQTVVNEVCSYLGLSAPANVEKAKSHNNKSWYPAYPKLHLLANYFMKGRSDGRAGRYRQHWPGDSSESRSRRVGVGDRLFRSLLFRMRFNLPKRESYPPMDEALRRKLTHFYARRNKGIGDLIGTDVGKYWPFE